MNFAEYSSPLGRLLLESDGTALTGLRFGGEKCLATEENAVLLAAKAWLDGYFRGEELPLTFPLRPQGTVFQKTVWLHLCRIPWGQTRTYGELARIVAEDLGKKAMSAQAIGQAVGRNPISILIPCHRVIGAKGQLTGYAWGIGKKQWLLRHEAGEEEYDHQ